MQTIAVVGSESQVKRSKDKKTGQSSYSSSPAGAGAVAIAAHSNHTFAVLSGGGIMFWGDWETGDVSRNITGFTSPTSVDVGAGKLMCFTCIWSAQNTAPKHININIDHL